MKGALLRDKQVFYFRIPNLSRELTVFLSIILLINNLLHSTSNSLTFLLLVTKITLINARNIQVNIIYLGMDGWKGF